MLQNLSVNNNRKLLPAAYVICRSFDFRPSFFNSPPLEKNPADSPMHNH